MESGWTTAVRAAPDRDLPRLTLPVDLEAHFDFAFDAGPPRLFRIGRHDRVQRLAFSVVGRAILDDLLVLGDCAVRNKGQRK